MAKIRLNQGMRNELMSFAYTLIDFPEQKAAAEAQKAKVDKMAREAISHGIPPADLEVLERYGHIESKRRFYFAYYDDELESSRVTEWYFQDHDEEGNEVELPKWHAGYSNKNVPGTKELYEAIDESRRLDNEHTKARSTLETDYRNLINSAYSFEELLEVWPEAEVMRAGIESRANRKAISNLSAEAIQRIKADVTARMAATDAAR